MGLAFKMAQQAFGRIVHDIAERPKASQKNLQGHSSFSLTNCVRLNLVQADGKH